MGNATFGRRRDKTFGWDVDAWIDCAGGSTDCEGTETGSTDCGAGDWIGISGFSSSAGGGAAVGSATTGVSSLTVERVAILRLVLTGLANFPAFSAACAACAANFCSRRSLSAFLSLILFGLVGEGGIETLSWLIDCSAPSAAFLALDDCNAGSFERWGGRDN